MIGFIKGLFGSKKKAEEQPTQPSTTAPMQNNPTNTGAFYLEFDDARTYGNLDYMRTSKKIRRTFPKTASSPEEMELIQQVSAMKMEKMGREGNQAESQSAMTPESSTPKANEATERRRTDTSLDMFRNMARDIRK